MNAKQQLEAFPQELRLQINKAEYAERECEVFKAAALYSENISLVLGENLTFCKNSWPSELL